MFPSQSTGTFVALSTSEAMWLTSSLLIGALALHRHDPVFIALQASSLTSTTVIVFLTHRYRGMVCAAHAHVRPDEHPIVFRSLPSLRQATRTKTPETPLPGARRDASSPCL